LDVRTIQSLVYDNKFKNRFKQYTSNASRAGKVPELRIYLTVLLF
jgi:hypothetical protein